VPYSSKVQQ